jgi:nicotinamidase-related amidase
MLPVAGTVPYPWPYDAEHGVDPARFALVVTGAQKHWAPLATAAAAANIDELAARIRTIGGLVVLVRHARPAHARPDAELPETGSADWELIDAPAARDVVVDVAAHDAFLTGSLDLELRAHGCDHLLLAGFASELLLDSTLRSANDRGYECLTLTDAVAPFDPSVGTRALASITMSGGIFGAVGTTAAVLDALGVPAQKGPR